jgi:hypothetical protein
MQHRRFAPALGALVALIACAAHGNAQSPLRSTGITAAVMPPETGSERFEPVAAWLSANRMLDGIAAMMNETVRWTRPVALIADECGRATAFYRANAESAAIVLCYELVDQIVDRFRQDDLSRIDRATAQTGAVAFVIFHEVGHALIDQLSLPVDGREESAASEFAALALGSAQPMAAFWAARFLSPTRSPGNAEESARVTAGFAAEHAIDDVRLNEIICWSFGADPNAALRLLRAGALPVERASQCEREYGRLSTAWELLLAPHTRNGAPTAHVGS